MRKIEVGDVVKIRMELESVRKLLKEFLVYVPKLRRFKNKGVVGRYICRASGFEVWSIKNRVYIGNFYADQLTIIRKGKKAS